MISYELAQELKDCGFPQGNTSWKGNSFWVYPDGKTVVVPVYMGQGNKKADLSIYSPTLSELIEACGDRIVSIMKNHNFRDIATGFDDRIGYILEEGWRAGMPKGWDDGSTWIDDKVSFGEGKTPEEAVANLYIALNSKKNKVEYGFPGQNGGVGAPGLTRYPVGSVGAMCEECGNNLKDSTPDPVGPSGPNAVVIP